MKKWSFFIFFHKFFFIFSFSSRIFLPFFHLFLIFSSFFPFILYFFLLFSIYSSFFSCFDEFFFIYSPFEKYFWGKKRKRDGKRRNWNKTERNRAENGAKRKNGTGKLNIKTGQDCQQMTNEQNPMNKKTHIRDITLLYFCPHYSRKIKKKEPGLSFYFWLVQKSTSLNHYQNTMRKRMTGLLTKIWLSFFPEIYQRFLTGFNGIMDQRSKYTSLTECESEKCHILIDLDGLWWVLMGFGGFWLDFGGFWWTWMGFDGFWWVLVGFDWILVGFSGIWWPLMGFFEKKSLTVDISHATRARSVMVLSPVTYLRFRKTRSRCWYSGKKRRLSFDSRCCSRAISSCRHMVPLNFPIWKTTQVTSKSDPKK